MTDHLDFHPHRMTDGLTVQKFILAGDARFTIVSKKTGKRFTYRVCKAENAKPGRFPDVFFVKVLDGPDNDSHFRYMGRIKLNEFARTEKAKVSETAPSFVAFTYFWNWLVDRGQVHRDIEFWHEGRCGCCHRPLTVPESIEVGIGPVCAERMGIDLFPNGRPKKGTVNAIIEGGLN